MPSRTLKGNVENGGRFIDCLLYACVSYDLEAYRCLR